MSTTRPRSAAAVVGALAAATLVLGACTNSSDDSSTGATRSNTDNDQTGDTVTIGFSALEQGRRQTPVPSGLLDAPDDPSSVAIRGFVSEAQFVRGLRALIAGLGLEEEE